MIKEQTGGCNASDCSAADRDVPEAATAVTGKQAAERQTFERGEQRVGGTTIAASGQADPTRQTR